MLRILSFLTVLIVGGYAHASQPISEIQTQLYMPSGGDGTFQIAQTRGGSYRPPPSIFRSPRPAYRPAPARPTYRPAPVVKPTSSITRPRLGVPSSVKQPRPTVRPNLAPAKPRSVKQYKTHVRPPKAGRKSTRRARPSVRPAIGPVKPNGVKQYQTRVPALTASQGSTRSRPPKISSKSVTGAMSKLKIPLAKRRGVPVGGADSKISTSKVNPTLVIGKTRNLTSVKTGKTYSALRGTKLRKNEYSLLDRLPNRGSVRANWKQNSSVLRQEMAKRRPIRDGSVDKKTGRPIGDSGFLKAERRLLFNNGWRYSKNTQHWHPPKN